MTSLAVEGLKNNINNYKGVMLCTRPNENIGAVKERPFVSRVDPKDRLGVNPVKKNYIVVVKKKGNPILQRHRAWLNTFKERMREKKELDDTRDKQDQEKFERVREQASRTRSPAHYGESHDYNTSGQVHNAAKNYSQPEQSSPVQIEQVEEVKPKKTVTKKKENKEKPKWAYTEEQVKAEEDEELDDLLNFTSNLDYDKYINDLEVKNMVAALKNRIDELKTQDAEEDWKSKIVEQWNGKEKEAKKAMQTSKVDIEWDARSDARSVASESKSVASERTNKSINELKSKLEGKEKKDWDQLSTVSKKNAVTVEERIAKHVADEILRNNYQFKHFHSNASIRKLLEKEAQKHMEDNKGIRAPQIVANKEYFARKDVQDPNNLPYLHRNPAI